MTLKELKVGESAYITAIKGKGALRQHLLDMGLIPGVQVSLIKLAPLGDPMEIRIHCYELSLRLADAANIHIDRVNKALPECQEPITANEGTPYFVASHPGLGEGGIYHEKAFEKPLSPGTTLTFALVGNQNSGKTTLFNQLTGANQHVGNFPGITIERKDGVIKRRPNTLITDLPGIYSLSPYTGEERVTRNFILDNRPKGIINIVDATNIERNLYLTMQLMELDIPMVLALNMMDEVKENGGAILINEMERRLGIPVVPISANKNEGIEELVDHALHVAQYQECPGYQDFCSPDTHKGVVHRCLHAIMHLIEDHAERSRLPLRFAASKLAEGDPIVLEQLQLDDNEKEALQHLLKQMEEERGLDRAAAIADMRFEFIHQVCAATVIRPKTSREHLRSLKADSILTGKWTAIPGFLAIMTFIFWCTFGPLGQQLSQWLGTGIQWLTDIVEKGLIRSGVNPVVKSLVIDGMFTGVGSVLSFLPYIVVLFFFLSIIEDSGYMARVAFVMDKPLRKIGLSGRSIIPMLIGFGCTVPAVIASRTLPSERDRKLTILLTPFMSCSAKLPIYVMLTAAFFPRHGTLVMIGLYLAGIATGILTVLIMRRMVFHGNPVPFVMELPNYRMPGIKNVGLLLWDKAKDFITRAFTVIFVATIVIWFLQTFDARLNVVSDSKDSLLALFASLIAPVFKPMGFGNWQVATALITGFMAKESVVSTLTILLGGSTAALASFITPLAALSLLIFILIYTPCVAAIASVRRELGSWWAIGMVVVQCLLAWILSYGIHLLGSLWL